MRGNMFRYLRSLTRTEDNPMVDDLIRLGDGDEHGWRGAGITGTHPRIVRRCCGRH